MQRKLSEASLQDERIDQPAETTKKGGIDAEPDSLAQAEERRLPGNADVEKQTTQGAQREGTREQTGSSEQPLEGNLIPRESNYLSAEEIGKHEQAEQQRKGNKCEEEDAI